MTRFTSENKMALIGLFVITGGCGSGDEAATGGGGDAYAFTCDAVEEHSVCTEYHEGYREGGGDDLPSLCQGTNTTIRCSTTGVLGTCDTSLNVGLDTPLRTVERYYDPVPAPHTIETLRDLCTDSSGHWSE